MAMNCPQPLESLQATPIPAFLSKTYHLADDPSLDPLISWGSTGHTFVVWDPTIFSTTVLPHCFKHNNFSSFVRQLNTYGFRKVHPDRWEFAHEDFIRGKRHYLKNIHRRRPSLGQHTGSTSGSTGDAATALELEIEHLKKDKTLLMEELVKLQQEHHGRMNQVEAVKRRLVTAEQMQNKVISFLAKLLRNPVFLSHLQNMSKQKQITSPRMKRKFVEHSQAEENDDSPHEEHIVKLHNIHSATKSSVQTVDGYHSDNLLQHVVEKVDHGMNYTHSQVQNMPLDEVDEERMPPGNHFEIGGSSLGSLEYEDDSFKENDVVSHQFQACSESLLPYQQDLAKKSTLSDFMSPKVEGIVKHEDVWNIVDLNVSSGMDTSRQDCWMNLTSYDDKEIGSVDGFSNLWDWEFQEAVVDVGVANCLGEEFSLEHLASQAELTQNDLYKNSHD